MGSADHLFDVAKLGYNKSRKLVLGPVENVIQEKGILQPDGKGISSGLLRRFMSLPCLFAVETQLHMFVWIIATLLQH